MHHTVLLYITASRATSVGEGTYLCRDHTPAKTKLHVVFLPETHSYVDSKDSVMAQI